MKIITRMMLLDDCPAVTQLLQANAQSQQGGLYGEYPANKVISMYKESLHTLVLLSDSHIIGVLFSFSPTSQTLPPVAQEIVHRFPKLIHNNWFYGPVCIDQAFRGKSLLTELYNEMCRLNSGIPIAFIDSKNPISLKAHQKMNMRILTQITFYANNWFIMVAD